MRRRGWGGVALGFFPRRRRSAAVAIAQDASVDGVNVLLDFPLLDFLTRLANAALQHGRVAGCIEAIGRGKLDGPEVGIGIDEGNAVDVAARFAADWADEADFRLLVGTGQAQR